MHNLWSRFLVQTPATDFFPVMTALPFQSAFLAVRSFPQAVQPDTEEAGRPQRTG